MILTANFRRRAYVLALVVMLIPAANANYCSGLLYATDLDRAPHAGSKQALLNAATRGDAIRVGWQIDTDKDGAADLLHWADAAFVTIWEGEVFAQVDAIQRQQPRRGDANVRLGADPALWRGLISSKGTLEGILSTDKANMARRPLSVTWCRQDGTASDIGTASAEPPAYLIVVGNVNDRDAFRTGYAAKLAPIYKKYGGEYVAIGRGVEVLEGNIAPESYVIARWPSMAAGRAFWNSPEYAALKKARIDGDWGNFIVLLVPGLAQQTQTAPMTREKQGTR